MKMKELEYFGFLYDLASECLMMNNYSPEATVLIDFMRSRLVQIDCKVVSAVESPYRLVVTVARDKDEQVGLEINFDKQGLVSSLRPLTCSSPDFVETIRSVLS